MGLREGNVYDYFVDGWAKSLLFAAFHGVGVERKWFLVCVYIYFVLHVKSWRLDRRIDKETLDFFPKSIFSLPPSPYTEVHMRYFKKCTVLSRRKNCLLRVAGSRTLSGHFIISTNNCAV